MVQKIRIHQVHAFFAVIILLAVCNNIHAQIITTMAGGGVAGYAGDGGHATAALLKNPTDVVVDGTGNVFIADAHNHCIRKINVSGIITTFAGTGSSGFSGDGGPATAAQFTQPTGIAIDGTGNMYIADWGNHRVRMINTSGTVSTVAGTGTIGYSGDGGPATAAEIGNPNRLLFDPSGNLYVSDHIKAVIRKINTSGIISTFAGTGIAGFSGDGAQATASQVYTPQSMVLDGVGNFYFADQTNQRIRKIDPSGIITTIAGNGATGMSAGGFSGDGGPATAALLRNPAGVAIDGLSNIYIADGVNNRIRKIDPSGIITTIAGAGSTGVGLGGFGGDGGPATAAFINYPTAVILNCNNLIIADSYNNRTRKIKYNNVPLFTGGHTQTLTVCSNTLTSVNSLLSASETDIGQTISWSVASTPAHGTVASTYTTISTGSVLTPSGLSYTPTAGYIGLDTFKIVVADCEHKPDTTTIILTVIDCSLGTFPSFVNNDISLFPNPVENVVNIETATGNLTSFIITNTIGQQMLRQSMTPPLTTVEVNKLPAGLYYITLTGAEGNVVKKFIKK